MGKNKLRADFFEYKTLSRSVYSFEHSSIIDPATQPYPCKARNFILSSAQSSPYFDPEQPIIHKRSTQSVTTSRNSLEHEDSGSGPISDSASSASSEHGLHHDTSSLVPTRELLS